MTIFQFCTEIRESDENKSRVKQLLCNVIKNTKPLQLRFTKGINIEVPIGQCLVNFDKVLPTKLEHIADKNYYP